MKKPLFYIISSVGVLLFSFIIGFLIGPCNLFDKKETNIQPVQESKTEAIMLMIEFEGMEGLVNFVSDIKERDIPGVLIVSADFVEENCDEIRSILKYHDIEIAGLEPTKPQIGRAHV